MVNQTRERLYRSSNPLAINKELCDSDPIKTAFHAALIADFGATDLQLAVFEQERDERRLWAATVNLERGLWGLWYLLDGEPLMSKQFSDLHDQPVAVGGIYAPSYVEGVYRWLYEAAGFLRAISLASNGSKLDWLDGDDLKRWKEAAAFYKSTFPMPDCMASFEFAEVLASKIDSVDEPTLIAAGIQMEMQKIGVDLFISGSDSGSEENNREPPPVVLAAAKFIMKQMADDKQAGRCRRARIEYVREFVADRQLSTEAENFDKHFQPSKYGYLLDD